MSEPLLVLRTREELVGLVAGRPPGPLALVPTMGALHAGHEALVRHAAGLAPTTVVSVFVNPTQFAPGEDFDLYPRTFDADLERAAAAGATAVLAPEVPTVYPGWPDAETVSVDPGPLGSVLEGASRPTHFRGVLTVVAKLFGLVRPDVAVFGEKDYQQLVLVRRMAATLCLGVDVVGVPTVREEDGLAMSSRNRYLGADDRRRAAALFPALRAGVDAAADGHPAVLTAARSVLAGADGIETDYIALTDADLGEPDETREARLLVAARVGNTRLIDNVAVRTVRGRPASPVRMGA